MKHSLITAETWVYCLWLGLEPHTTATVTGSVSRWDAGRGGCPYCSHWLFLLVKLVQHNIEAVGEAPFVRRLVGSLYMTQANKGGVAMTEIND